MFIGLWVVRMIGSVLKDPCKARTELLWLNPACADALEHARGGLFSEVV